MTGRDALRDRILLAALPNVPFDGWTDVALVAGAESLGLGKADALRAFPGGAAEAVEHFSDWADRMMLARLAERDLKALPLRERIAAGVRARLEVLTPHREAVRRALSRLALGRDGLQAAASTYQTVSAIWYAAGDTSADFSFYTKRGLLAGVHGATVLYWLSDESENCEETWAFLERRLEGVMAFHRATGQVQEMLGRMPVPFRPFRT